MVLSDKISLDQVLIITECKSTEFFNSSKLYLSKNLVL
jgi:hypothetical protein